MVQDIFGEREVFNYLKFAFISVISTSALAYNVMPLIRSRSLFLFSRR